jgi:hypothetical protein
MVQKRFWFFPDIDLLTYIRKYPLVFIVSLLSALFWFPEFLIRIYLHIPRGSGNGDLPGYSFYLDSLYFGIPFFALLHLFLNDRRFQLSKYRVLVQGLGLLVLYGFFAHFSGADALDTSKVYRQFVMAACLAVLLFPLSEMWDSAEKRWAYFTNLAVTSVGSGLLWLASTMLLDLVISHIPTLKWGSYVPYGEIAPEMGAYLIFPWYFMGALDKAIRPKQGGKEKGMVLDRRIVIGGIFLVVLLYLFDGFVLIKGWISHKSLSDEFFDNTSAYAAIALGSFILMVPMTLRNAPGWTTVYRKWASGISIPLLVYAAYEHFHPLGTEPWGIATYSDFFLVIWLVGTFCYFLLKDDPSWKWPALAGLAMLVVTLAGPLSPWELGYGEHRRHLEAVLKDAGMLSGGHVVKPATEPDKKVYAKITEEINWITQNAGLNRIQGLFTQDLGALRKSVEGNSWSDSERVAESLMEMVGVQQCDVYNFPSLTTSYASKRQKTLDVSGFGEYEALNFSGGCPINPSQEKEKHYVTGLSGENEILAIKYGDEFVADIPLAKLTQNLMKYDYSQITRRMIPQREMTLDYENQKIKVRICFFRVSAFKVGDHLKVSSGEGALLAKRK